MGTIDEIADRYLDAWASLDPVGATFAGVAGAEDHLTDLSPDGFAARAELDRRTLAELTHAEHSSPRELVAKEAMQENLAATVALSEAGHFVSEVSVISSAIHHARGVFDIMPVEDEQGVENVVARMRALPNALSQWRRTLREAADRGNVVSRHQLVEVADQCARWASPTGDDVFGSLAAKVGALVSPTLREELARAAGTAAEAVAATGRFLADELARRGRERQAVGREHYRLVSRYFLGSSIDLDDAYAWGFEELARIEGEMERVAASIVPGGSVDAAVAALEARPGQRIEGKDAFRAWMQDRADEAIEALHGTHFDIPEPVRRIECCFAPTSDGGIYYTGPSEDFARPGRMWWAVPDGITGFDTWQQATTVYHEGVPGHHLQIGQTVTRPDLNRWQRRLSWSSGHGEGWALYAERLMDELGFLTDPGARLGMLEAQAFRAVRVILDIGMHLELRIPRDNRFGFHPGERWTPELGWEFMLAHCRSSQEMLRFEFNRYLGWPGQAPAYKIGERVWLEERAAAKARKGASFDLVAFHRDALNLGSLGLDPFRAALSRL